MSFKIKLKHNWNKIRLYLSFLLLAFYLTVAFVFLFSDTWADLIPKGRAIIGLILFLFGSLRFYIAYRRYEKKNLKIEALKEFAHANAQSSTTLSMTERAESV